MHSKSQHKSGQTPGLADSSVSPTAGEPWLCERMKTPASNMLRLFHGRTFLLNDKSGQLPSKPFNPINPTHLSSAYVICQPQEYFLAKNTK